MKPSQVANDPEQFARVFLRILNKEKQLVPLRWNAMQRDFDAHRTGHDLILKSRQLGASTYVQGELFRRTVTSTRTTITLSHDSESTQKLRRMADRFWRNCRFGDLQPVRHYANATLSTYPEFDSTAIIATAGSLNTGRGDTYSDLHGSEVAFWPDAESIIAGAMQGGNPDVVLESTPNGAQGFFYDLCMEALRGEGIWKIHFYPWWWDEHYRLPLDDGEQLEFTEDETLLAQNHRLAPEQIKWRRAKQRELKQLFIQEYPEDPYTCFITSGKSYFGDLSQVYTAPLHAEWQPAHRYQAGLDFGQSTDFTALPVIDKTARQQVDLLHVNGLEWKEIRNRIRQTSDRWTRSTCEAGHVTRGARLRMDQTGKSPELSANGSKQYLCLEPGCDLPAKVLRPEIRAEKNSIGQVNIEILQEDGLDIIPFETTNASKAEIMAELHESLHAEQQPLRLQDHPVQRHELSTMVSTQLPSGIWRLAAEGDGHDDTVIGLALANTDSASGWLEHYRKMAEQLPKEIKP